MSFNFTVKIHGGNEDQPENIKELKPRKPRNKRRYKTKKTQATRKSNRLSKRKTAGSPKETKVAQDETENSALNSLFGQIRSNAKWIALSLGGIMATIVVATIAFFLCSDQGLQMDNLEQIMDHSNLLDVLSENFSIPIGIVLALVALFFYVWLVDYMNIWNTTSLTRFKFVLTFIPYNLFEIFWSILFNLKWIKETF